MESAGILVGNFPHNPFWKAYVDGTKIETFPVNLIHTAVAIPRGTKRVKFIYRI